MRYHHTKNKGDFGLIKAMVDLTAKGWLILTPLTEHAPFDLVAYRDGRFLRVQVKYRKVRQGCVDVQLRSIWADRRANHYVPLDRDALDLICIYCADNDCCYYIDPKRVSTKSVYLRVTPARNMTKRVVLAKDFTEIPESVLGIRPATEAPLERLPFVRHSHEPQAQWAFAWPLSSVG